MIPLRSSKERTTSHHGMMATIQEREHRLQAPALDALQQECRPNDLPCHGDPSVSLHMPRVIKDTRVV